MGRGSFKKSNNNVAKNLDTNPTITGGVACRTRSSPRTGVSPSQARASKSTPKHKSNGLKSNQEELMKPTSLRSSNSVDKTAKDDARQMPSPSVEKDCNPSGSPEQGDEKTELSVETNDFVVENESQVEEYGQSNSENNPGVGDAIPTSGNLTPDETLDERFNSTTADSMDKCNAKRVGNEIRSGAALSQRDANLGNSRRSQDDKSQVIEAESLTSADQGSMGHQLNTSTECSSEPTDVSSINEYDDARVRDSVEEKLEPMASYPSKLSPVINDRAEDYSNVAGVSEKVVDNSQTLSIVEVQDGVKAMDVDTERVCDDEKANGSVAHSTCPLPGGNRAKPTLVGDPRVDEVTPTTMDSDDAEVSEKSDDCSGKSGKSAAQFSETPTVNRHDSCNAQGDSTDLHASSTELSEHDKANGPKNKRKFSFLNVNGVGNGEHRPLDGCEHGESSTSETNQSTSDNATGTNSSSETNKQVVSTSVKTRSRNKRNRNFNDTDVIEETGDTRAEAVETSTSKLGLGVKDNCTQARGLGNDDLVPVSWEIVKTRNLRVQLRRVTRNSDLESNKDIPKMSNMGHERATAKRQRTHESSQNASESSQPRINVSPRAISVENGCIGIRCTIDKNSGPESFNTRTDVAANLNGEGEKQYDTEPQDKQQTLRLADIAVNDDDSSRWKRSDQTAGVGLNRIRISPVDEERTPHSIAHKVVQKLLVQYGLLESTGDVDPKRGSEPETPAKSHFTNPPNGSGNADSTSNDAEKNRNKKPTCEASIRRSAALARVDAVSRLERLVHDYKLPNEQSYCSGRPSTKKRVLPPILLDEIDKEGIPRTLQHLNPDLRVDIINRKSGRVLTGEKAVAIKDLPNLLKKHASYEPIVPPPSSDWKS